MSVMICSNECFKATAKVCFAQVLEILDSSSDVGLEKLNNVVKDVAQLNIECYADRYNEDDVQVEVDLFDELPSPELTPQDIFYARCWRYQIEGDWENEMVYRIVDNAIDWAIKKYKYTDEDFKGLIWG